MKRIALFTLVILFAFLANSCHFFKDESLLGSWRTVGVRDGITVEKVLTFDLTKAESEDEKDVKKWTSKTYHDKTLQEETEGIWNSNADWLKGGVEKVILTLVEIKSEDESSSQRNISLTEENENDESEEKLDSGARTYIAQISNNSTMLQLIEQKDDANYQIVYQRLSSPEDEKEGKNEK